MTLRRLPRASVAAAGLLALDVLIRLGAGGPYPGATLLLLVACGLSLLPFLPSEVGRPSLRIAVLPALALGSFAILLTTVSIVGIPLTELSIRLAAWVLVAALGIAAAASRSRDDGARPISSSVHSERLAVVVLLGVLGFSLASSWDIVDPFPPNGTDWGHYLQYADEVESQHALLIDDPLAGEEGRLFGDPPGVGALYGSVRVLDGVSSRALGSGLIVVSAVVPLSLFAAVGALWGLGAGLLAAAVYAVSPIRLEPMYWHGLGTTLAFVFFPLLLLAFGLMFRGRRDWRTIGLLGFSLTGVAVSHSTSAVVAAFVVAAALAFDAVRSLVARRSPRSWWCDGIVRSTLAGVAVACVGGAGVIAHLRAQAADLGEPVDYRFFEPDWLTREVLVDYYSLPFLALAAASLALLLAARGLRGDPALLAVAALAVGSIVVSQLWRLEVPFEYRRAVYYFGLALAVVIGVASVRLSRLLWWAAGYVLVLAYIAHVSIGFRLPERLLTGPDERSRAVAGLIEFRKQLDRRTVPDTERVVADRCLHFVVPYLLHRPTLAAFEEWQVGFTNRLSLARKAARVLEGGVAGRRLAASLGVRYAVVDPRCTPDVASRLGGAAVVENDELAVIRLPPPDF